MYVSPRILASVGRGLVSFLVGASFLVLTACSGGGGSGGGSAKPFEVELTFAPIVGGFIISNQSDFGDLVSLRLIATSRGQSVEKDIDITAFSDGSYEFTDLSEQSNYTFAIRGILSDGRELAVEIAFGWEENEEDHKSGGIWSGLDTDGDRRADIVDDDDDNDGVLDLMEMGMFDGRECRLYEDCDRDGVLDNMEEVGCATTSDCDNDTVDDYVDGCPAGAQNWQSNLQTDRDGDGCRGADEDIDDDGDGLIEIGTAEQLDAVRYALDSSGRRPSADTELSTAGCGDGSNIYVCAGYELVANISLAAYSAGEGWQPLGYDNDSDQVNCQGDPFSGTFQGNGFVISDLRINRSTEDCVGLFGAIASGSTIVNLTLQAEEVIGDSIIGALVGFGREFRIVSSSAVVGQVSGDSGLGGLVGTSEGVRIISSSIVVGQIRGGAWIGGLVGVDQDARIVSSSAIVGQLGGLFSAGGLIGWGEGARIVSSSVVAGEVGGGFGLGGLGGDLGASTIAYSYAVLGNSNVDMLAATGGANLSSYWDSATSGIADGDFGARLGAPKTTDELRMPINYTGIYATWDDGVDIDNRDNDDDIETGVDDITIYCDEDASGDIESAEARDGNRIWDFGSSSQYPAIRCNPHISPSEWRSWWFLNGTDELQLNQTRLDALLPSSN